MREVFASSRRITRHIPGSYASIIALSVKRHKRIKKMAENGVTSTASCQNFLLLSTPIA